MATLPTLYPTGKPVNVSDTGTWSGAYTDMDEGISGADGTEIGENTNATGDYAWYVTLTDMPGDFLSLTTLSVQIRYRVAGAQTNTRNLTCRVWTDESTPVALTSDRSIATGISNTTLTNSSVLGFTITGTPTKAQWDNAILEIRESVTKNKGGDTNGIRIDSVELTGTYVAAQTVSPGVISDPATVNAPTVVPGSFTVTQSAVIADPATVNAPTVSLSGGEQTVTQSAVIADPATVNAPTVTPGSVTVSPGVVADPATVNAPTVTPGSVTVSLDAIADPATVNAPTVSVSGGLQTVTQSAVIADPDTVNAPTVTSSVTVSPGVVTAAATVYAPTLTSTVTVSPGVIADAATVNAPTITPGSVTVTIDVLTIPATVYAPSISGARIPVRGWGIHIGG